MNRKRTSKHLKLWFLTSILILAIAGSIIWVVQTSSDAQVSEVSVQVSDRNLIKPIKNVAAIEIGERITELNLTAAAARIMQLPQVRTAAVDRRWPDRIVISVDLREPIGWLREVDEIWYLDVTGEKYLPKVAVAKPGLPEFVTASEKSLLASATAYQFLPDKLKRNLDRVTAATSSNIRFIFTSGVTVIWGSADRNERKAEVLTVLLQRKAKIYDVSAPDLPTIRLK